MRKYSLLAGALPAFLITAAITFNAAAQTATKPDDNRFTKVVLAQRVEEPMQFQIMKDGKVLYAERKGKLKLYNPATGKITVIGQLAVSNQYVSQTGEVSEGEDGLQGVILDPDFDKNHWIYIYYSPAGNDPKNTLARFNWDGKGQIDMDSRKVVMDVVVQRFECCHVGGGMVFDKNKNLYLSTGDNTFSRASDGFTPLDERPGKFPEDSQKGASNTNDLRGKILRIHPEPDATYTIPKGNLFPVGTPKTRPEIYTMGDRNPWRLTIDSKTGWLYWGEVGPDGGRDDPMRGPQSYDEFNMAKKPGNYGWPYFEADNKPYRKYDFATKKSGDWYDPAHPVNTSPNNTGLTELPPAVPSLIWEGKSLTKEFPLMDSGSDSAVGGPIFHLSDFTDPKRPFPPYYEGKWFITDWVRGWINVVTVDNDGKYVGMERFLPNEPKLRGPIDMKFGPQGDLYVLEYGNGYFKDNPEAELIRIEYNGGNRKPQVEASANKTAGAVPLKVALSSKGTKDYDEGDVLTYEWKITKNGVPYKTFKQPDPSVTFTTPGVYKALLTVTDLKGAKNSRSVEIKAGNEPPVVKFNITAGNSSFFFPGKSVEYSVSVADKEDGSLANKRILPSRVSISANYLSEGYNMTAIVSRQGSVDASAEYAGAIGLIAKSDCRSCHSVTEKVLGPAFVQVAQKYKGDPGAPDRLVKKIISGGSGVWGDAMMAAHPTLAESDGKAIVKYILSLAYPPRRAKSLPVTGTYTTTIPEGENTDGSFILRAAYTDRGTKAAAAQTGESIVVLHAPLVPASKAGEIKDIAFNIDSTVASVKNAGAWLKFNKIDLTGIKQLEIAGGGGGRRGTVANGTIEVYTDSPQGKLLGKFSGDYSAKGMKISLPDGTAGVSDLYFVFNGSPLRLSGIKFSDGN